jgi:hypothetical protein
MQCTAHGIEVSIVAVLLSPVSPNQAAFMDTEQGQGCRVPGGCAVHSVGVMKSMPCDVLPHSGACTTHGIDATTGSVILTHRHCLRLSKVRDVPAKWLYRCCAVFAVLVFCTDCGGINAMWRIEGSHLMTAMRQTWH